MNKKVVLILGVLVISVFLAWLFFEHVIVRERIDLFTSMQVKGNVGLNIDNDALYFGGIPPGGFGDRDASFTYPYDSYISIKVRGPIKEFITVSDASFFLSADETKNLRFSVQVPDDTPYDWYNGSIQLVVKRWPI